MVVLVVMGSSFLSEVHDASDQERAPRSVTSYHLLPPLPQATLPRSGYRGSDLVRWHDSDNRGDATTSAVLWGNYRRAKRVDRMSGLDPQLRMPFAVQQLPERSIRNLLIL